VQRVIPDFLFVMEHYLGFVDADDWVDPDYVTALVAGIGNDDMIVCGFYVVEADTCYY
jgi:hypothetical protein